MRLQSLQLKINPDYARRNIDRYHAMMAEEARRFNIVLVSDKRNLFDFLNEFEEMYQNLLINHPVGLPDPTKLTNTLYHLIYILAKKYKLSPAVIGWLVRSDDEFVDSSFAYFPTGYCDRSRKVATWRRSKSKKETPHGPD